MKLNKYISLIAEIFICGLSSVRSKNKQIWLWIDRKDQEKVLLSIFKIFQISIIILIFI